ncbi:polysaccharide deacetylase family protein [Sphaerisporangium fuscum]|uniref:polysaccharide deacetylase family protein n=1 Tax=Sphaerisporangium fuscum TaxID=2835868 RepID=UPI002029A765|nr:polysaccharide deacetylase family protein [Sphaerisporangium fuscum]
MIWGRKVFAGAFGVALVAMSAACGPTTPPKTSGGKPSTSGDGSHHTSPGRTRPRSHGNPGEPVAAMPQPGEVTPIRKPANGMPPVISSIATKRKVVFLTIDDGWEQDPGFVQLVKDRAVPIMVFAMRDAVEARGVPDPTAAGGKYVGAGKWSYFQGLRDLGVPIEAHTLTHPNLWHLGPAAQKAEICGSAKVITKEIGRRPTLFRPPFGNYNPATLQAVKDCDLSAVLLWTATVQPGGKIAYQTPDKKLHPGDILLLHFRPHLARDFRILLDKIKRRGFALGDLPAYLKASGV